MGIAFGSYSEPSWYDDEDGFDGGPIGHVLSTKESFDDGPGFDGGPIGHVLASKESLSDE